MPEGQTFTDVQPIAQTFTNVQPVNDSAHITGISAQPKPTGIADRLSQWAKNVSDDIKNGTDVTGIGTVLKKMGAHGVYNGNSQAVGDYMASLPLGLLKTAQGAGELGQGKIAQGAGDVAGGALQAVTLPASLGSPLEAEAAATGAGKVAQVVSDLTPAGRAAKAVNLFKDIESKIGEHTVSMTDELGNALSEIKEGIDTGLNAPSVVNKFVTRIADTEQPPLTYAEARKFYSNMGDLATSEKMAANSKMQRLIFQVQKALGNAISTTAEQGGKLQQYRDAMKGFAGAMTAQDRVDMAKSLATKAAGTAALGATGYAGYRGLKDILEAGQ